MVDESKLNQVCYATRGFDEPWTLESYLAVGGYSALSRSLFEMSPEQVLVRRAQVDHRTDTVKLALVK